MYNIIVFLINSFAQLHQSMRGQWQKCYGSAFMKYFFIVFLIHVVNINNYEIAEIVKTDAIIYYIIMLYSSDWNYFKHKHNSIIIESISH